MVADYFDDIVGRRNWLLHKTRLFGVSGPWCIACDTCLVGSVIQRGSRWGGRGILRFFQSIYLLRLLELVGDLELSREGLLLRIRRRPVSNRVSILHFLIRAGSVQSFKSLQLICIWLYWGVRDSTCHLSQWLRRRLPLLFNRGS